MGRQVSRDSLPEEELFVWREAKQVACYCLLLCEKTSSNENYHVYIGNFLKTNYYINDHFRMLGSRLKGFIALTVC